MSEPLSDRLKEIAALVKAKGPERRAVFIAHAYENVAWLIAEVLRLREELRQYQESPECAASQRARANERERCIRALRKVPPVAHGLSTGEPRIRLVDAINKLRALKDKP